jgi:glycosyltransferase involved in cell wall biosynthesis
MDDLLPGQTTVLAYHDVGHWQPKAPYRLLRERRTRLLVPAVKQLNQVLRNIPSLSVNLPVHRFLKANGVEVMLGEYLNYSFDFLALAQTLGIRYYTHAHGADVSCHLRQPYWRKRYLNYRDAAGVITMNHLSRQRLIDLGLDGAKIHVIPYGVDVPAVPTHRPAGSVVRCLAVGRMVAKKAPLLLLRAFHQSLKVFPELRLDYVGEGELLSAAQQYVNDHQLGTAVTLHGGSPPVVVRQFMADAHIFLQHSVTDPATGDEEGLPVSILEAMAMALPVVSTRHAGIPEEVVEEETGLLVNEGDWETMGHHIATLARDYHLRAEMGDRGWQRASTKFSWARERQDLLAVMGLTSH